MNWQLLLVALLVAGAGLYLVQQTVRTWTGGKSGCGGGCSCGKAAASATANGAMTFIPASQLTLRRRLPSDRAPGAP